MTRIGAFVLQELAEGQAKARGALNFSQGMIERMAKDSQCDDEDRQAIERARREIRRGLEAL